MSASTWGNPNSTKRVLLLHALTSSSHSWHRIAPEFVSQGYFVIAPDLLGHGNAGRGSDYSIAAFVNELRPFLTAAEGNDHLYDIVIGHSLGAIVAPAIFPLLKSTRSVRVVLVDPPLERTPEHIASHRAFARLRLEGLRSPEHFQEMILLATKEDAIFGWLSARLCDVTTVDAVFDQNNPWSFSHLLLAIPDNVKVTVLAADPSKEACVKEEELKAYPDVTSKTIWGASHMIPLDAPQVIIEAALQSP